MSQNPHPFTPALVANAFLNATPLLVFQVGADGRFRFTNAATQAALQYSATELLGMRAADVLVDYTPAERAELRAQIARTGSATVRAVLRRKDGTTFPVEATNTLLPLDGETINCSICRDISAEVRRSSDDEQRITAPHQFTTERPLYAVADACNIVGSSRQLREVLVNGKRLARRGKRPLLITGETGVGKESLARFLHGHGNRAERPFVVVNCGNFTGDTLISRLFGHVKGAYTGAVRDRDGLFAAADGGTLFLDEIGELPPVAQQRLLRVLQDGSYYPLGSDKARRADVRIIAATNRDLPAMVATGTFREDLLYRINALPLALPPLRERLTDLPELIHHKIASLRREEGTAIGLPSPASMARLLAYDYPGNIRELFNLLERAYALTDEPEFELVVRPEYFPTPVATACSSPAPGNAFPTLEAVQIAHIERALDRTRGQLSGPKGAAALLGMNASTLRGRMRKFGIVWRGEEEL